MRGNQNQVDNFNSIFPYKVCINLDRRAERWERMKERFVQHRILSVVRFSAIERIED